MDATRECQLLRQLDAPPEGRFAEINGMEMYYEVHGEGRPLLLLHGFSATHSQWNALLPSLTSQFQVIALDLRGHGRSTNPTGEFTHSQSAQDVILLLNHLEIDRFKAIGASTGSMTLLHLATLQPNRPEALVLMAPTTYFPEPARELMRQMDPARLDERTNRPLLEEHLWGVEQVHAIRRQFHGFKDSYHDMNFTPPLLSTIRASTLIVHGDRDPLFEVSIPIEIYQSIPKSYLWIFPNTGHDIFSDFINDDPVPITDSLIGFLNGDWDSDV